MGTKRYDHKAIGVRLDRGLKASRPEEPRGTMGTTVKELLDAAQLEEDPIR